jgi:hypothetical protein
MVWLFDVYLYCGSFRYYFNVLLKEQLYIFMIIIKYASPVFFLMLYLQHSILK